MALQDPNDLTGFYDPAIEDALAAQANPYGFEWPPAHWQDDQFAPPLPGEQQLGGTMGVVEEAAAPAIANDPSIPTPTADSVNAIATPGADPLDELTLRHEGESLPPLPTGYQGPGEVAPEQRGDLPAQPAAPTFTGIQPKKSPEQRGIELGLDPVKLMRAQEEHAENAQRWSDEQAHSARIRDEMKAQQNYQRQLDVQERTRVDMEKLNSDAIALSKTKIDPSRWYRERSTAGKIGAWVAAITGGLISGRTGGPNQGLANIMKMIDDDVDAQKADLSNQQQALGVRRGIVNDNFARSGDAFRSAEAFRLASYERVKADLQTQQAHYDPEGATAIRIGRMIQDIGARSAAAQAAALDRYFKVHTADADLQGKLLANAAASKKLSGMGAGSAAPTAYGEKEFASVAPPPGFKGTQSAWLEMRNKYQSGKKLEQEVGAGGKVGEEQRQQKLVRGGMGLFDYDAKGNKVEFVPNGLDTEVAKLRAKKAGTQELVNILDEAMSIRTGWTSDKVAGEENQRLKTLMGKAQLAAKKAEDLGAITESDVGLIKGLLGTDDFTSWRGVSDAVSQARQNLIKSLRIEANGQGMSPRAAGEIDFPNLYAEKTKLSQEDGAYQALLGGKLDGDAKVTTLNAIAGAAQSTDPKVNGPARAKLRKLAEDSPDEVDRRSIKQWLAMPQFGGGQQ